MIIETTREKFLPLVTVADRLTSKNLSLPVLSGILLEVEGNSLLIKSTNLDLGFEASFPIKTTKPGRVVIAGSLLPNLLASLPKGETIKLTSDGGTLEIDSSHHHFSVSCLPAEDFPTIPRPEAAKSISLPSARLVAGLRSVIYSASLSTIKPEINSVYLFLEGKEVVLAATDSFRLGEKKISYTGELESLAAIIPLKNAQEISRVMAEVGGEEVTLTANANQLALTMGQNYLTSRLIDGVFPDYRQIMPKDFLTEVTLAKKDLLDTLKLSLVLLADLNQVKIEVEPSSKVVKISSATTNLGSSTSQIEAVVSGEAVSLNFNVRYLLDCLGTMVSDRVNLKFNGPSRPLLVSGVGDQSFRYLVMSINR